MTDAREPRERGVRFGRFLIGLLRKRPDGRWDVSIQTPAGPTYLGTAEDLREGRRMVRDNT